MPITLTGVAAAIASRAAPSISAPQGSDGPSAASNNTPDQSLLNLVASLITHGGLLDLANTWSQTNYFQDLQGHALAIDAGATVAGGMLLDILSATLAKAADFVVDQAGGNAGALVNSLRFGSATSGEAIASKRTAGGRQFGLDVYTNSTRRGGVSNTGVWDLNPSAVVIPGLVTGGYGSGRQKLGYWIDPQGNLHIQGYCNGLSLTAGGQTQVWANATLPSPFNSTWAIERPAMGSTAGGFQGIAYAAVSNGGLTLGAAHHETDTFSGVEVDITINPNIAFGP